MKEVSKRTYNAIAFLDLEETFETLTTLGNQIAEAFEAGDTAELGRLYFQALTEQAEANKKVRDEFRRKVWYAALMPDALRSDGVL
jgi:hypothetical protein